MDEKQKTPIKNLVQKQIEGSKNKIFFLQPYKPINMRQVSSQFRECNKRYFPNNIEKDDIKKIKHNNNNININYIKNNFFRLNSTSKYKISLSQEKENKTKKIHEDNLKKMKELQKILDDLNKNDNVLTNEIDKLNNEENNLKNELQKKDDEEKNLTIELNNLKNINDDKNREYLHLQQMNHHQQIENSNNNNHLNNNNNRQRIQNIDNNNSGNNNEDIQLNEIDLLNRLLRLQRQINGNNEREREGNGGENSLGVSLNDSNYEQIELLNEDLGPPMTMEQIEALPMDKYPKKDVYEEKCILCGFNFYYNDSITKLEQCQHIFHKECFTNFLIHRQASKCPICKVSLI